MCSNSYKSISFMSIHPLPAFAGPIRNKGVFVCACILPFVPVFWKCFALANEFLDSFGAYGAQNHGTQLAESIAFNDMNK